MTNPFVKLLILSPLLLLLIATPAQQVHALCTLPGPDLTGEWKGNDGGTYKVRAVGEELFWVGTSPDNGRSWINVFHGTRNGVWIKGRWADVGGGARSSGVLQLRVVDNGRINKAAMTGGFGGSTWTRGQCIDNEAIPSDE